MGAVLGFAILLACLWLLNRSVQQAREGAWTGPRTPGMRRRAAKGTPARAPGRAAVKAAKSAGFVIAHPGSGQIRAQAKADAYTAWQQAFAADWAEAQRHARANGTAAAAAPPEPKRTLRQRLRLVPPAGQSPGPGNGQQPANGTQPAAQGNGGPPARPVPPPPAPAQSSNGGTPVATGTSTAGAEQLIDGISKIHATAQAGGIHAKHAAVKSAVEGCIRFAGMLQMLSRQMSEPGQHYGPEITEPIGKTAAHLQAAAMTLGEADTNIATLINTTVGELARGARQAPHHEELNEAGAR